MRLPAEAFPFRIPINIFTGKANSFSTQSPFFRQKKTER
jgi:hypothetical protein